MNDSSCSTSISDVLDRIGLCPEDIDRRRKIWSFYNKLKNHLLNRPDVRMYITGSRVEGVGLFGLRSDVDMMLCYQHVRVLHDSSEWELSPRVLTLVTDVSTVHPGYCMLKIMEQSEPLLLQTTSTDAFPFTTWYGGEIVLNHQCFPLGDFFYSHGPASTPRGTNISQDHVRCFHTSWPPQAKKWIERDRPSNFPPSDFIHSAEEGGAFVVPVGHKASVHKDIEWRFSFSLLELKIIQMWPVTATRCYFVLKLLKDYITNQSELLDGTLCSYHMKTLMFWLVEETGIDYWLNHSLMECLIFSLTRLCEWVERGFIPQYFMLENNLLDVWNDETQQELLNAVISSLVSESHHVYRAFWCVIESNHIDTSSIDCKLKEGCSMYLNLLATLRESVLLFGKDMQSCGSVCELVQKTNTTIFNLSEWGVCYDQEIKSITGYMKEEFESICATHILSNLQDACASNISRFVLYRIMEKFFSGHLNNKAVAMRTANFFYQAGKYQRAIDIFQIVSDTTNHSTSKFSVAHNSCQINMEVITIFSAQNPFRKMSGIILPEHAFFRGEIKALPHALQYEMFRAAIAPRNFHDRVLNQYVDVLLIDPDVLHYYLQYLCFTQSEKWELAKVAFNNLKWVVNGGDVLHRGTALNVLGHCYMAQGNVRAAVNCFVEAIRVDVRCTAPSLVHLAIAIKKMSRPN